MSDDITIEVPDPSAFQIRYPDGGTEDITAHGFNVEQPAMAFFRDHTGMAVHVLHLAPGTHIVPTWSDSFTDSQHAIWVDGIREQAQPQQRGPAPTARTNGRGKRT